jgi:hypothetical protein
MTQVATKTATTNTAQAAAILRDAAFVLMMTKKVKDAMLGKGTEPSGASVNPARRRTAAVIAA